MFKAILMCLCLIVCAPCILSGCGGKEIVVEYKYVECKVPATPEKPKYAQVLFMQDGQGKICLVDDDSGKALLINDLLNKSHIEHLRTILDGMREKK